MEKKVFSYVIEGNGFGFVLLAHGGDQNLLFKEEVFVCLCLYLF